MHVCVSVVGHIPGMITTVYSQEQLLTEGFKAYFHLQFWTRSKAPEQTGWTGDWGHGMEGQLTYHDGTQQKQNLTHNYCSHSAHGKLDKVEADRPHALL